MNRSQMYNVVSWVGYALLICVPIIFLYSCLQNLAIIPAEWSRDRSSVHYARVSFRPFAQLLERDFEKNQSYFPQVPYYGPFTPEMLSKLGDHTYNFPERLRPKDDWAIDPFNREDPDQIRTGPKYTVDRGAFIRIRGNNYIYYTNGNDYYLLISYGPDDDLDLNQNLLDTVYQHESDPEQVLSVYSYDPTNGVGSNGDLFRASPPIPPPLHLAIRSGNLEQVKMLVENGNNINGLDHDSFTPLHEAARRGHTEIVRYLIDKGADISIQTPIGWTGLGLAAQNGHKFIAQILIEHGEDVDRGSTTPLYLAIDCSNLSIVKLLINNGADVNRRSEYGQTALERAVEREDFTIAKVLIDNGADPNIANDNGDTPLGLAKYYTMGKAWLDLLSGASNK